VLPDTKIVSNDCLTENELRRLALDVVVILLGDTVELALVCQLECYLRESGQIRRVQVCIFLCNDRDFAEGEMKTAINTRV